MSSNKSTAGPALPAHLRRIYLTGFMGAGKSTVGALLAERLQWQFVDLDHWIEAHALKRVSAIFADHGEEHFRELELLALRHAQANAGAVISLGGGAVETPAVRSLLAEDSAAALVFLEAPLSRLVERCRAQELVIRETGYEANVLSGTRPLLEQAELLQARYDRRLAHYRNAHLTVATEFLTPEEVAAAIHHQVAAFDPCPPSVLPKSYK